MKASTVSTILSVATLLSFSSALSVTVLGGTGFVGSRVCQQLVAEGASVTSFSKTGQVPKWCADEDWTKGVEWKSVDLLSAGCEGALKGTKSDAVISCVGVVGTDPEQLRQGNGEANVRAFGALGPVDRASLVSVASEVAACEENWLPEFFGGYFEGKKAAEEAALEAVGGDSSKLCTVKPTFIYGGDSFGLLPPRVTYDYGSGIEQLLSFGLITALADVTPGLIKVALRPPSSVDAVAAACVAGALGKVSGSLDGGPAINKATNQPDATGLTEAFEWSKENAIKFYDWAKVEVPKAIDVVKKAVDESKQK